MGLRGCQGSGSGLPTSLSGGALLAICLLITGWYNQELPRLFYFQKIEEKHKVYLSYVRNIP